MKTELTPYQQDLLANLAKQDDLYRELKRSARAEAILEAEFEIRAAADTRASMARRTVAAGVPRSTVHKLGLHTTDGETLRKLLGEVS